MHKHSLVALALISVGTFAQCAAVTHLTFITTHDNLATPPSPPVRSSPSPIARVAVGVRAPPNTRVPALSGTVFGLAALVTDPQFGAGVMYDILALALVQRRL
jgi:hypothetical protein